MTTPAPLVRRTAVVTGSSRGLGLAIANALAAAGVAVVVNARVDEDGVRRAAASCREHGVDSMGVLADVSKPNAAVDLIDKSRSAFGAVDILVNVVGGSPYVPLLELSDDEWHKLMAINVDSMFYCIKAALPDMLARGWGRIINVTGHAYMRSGVAAHTSASKAAAMGLTRAVASEVAASGITCNEMVPGFMDTEPRKHKYYDDRKPAGARPWGAVERVREVPQGRMGRPDELAAVCVFLCSDAASYVTGQTWMVNGGLRW